MHATDQRNAAGRCESQWGSVKPLFYSCGYCCVAESFPGHQFLYIRRIPRQNGFVVIDNS